MKCKLDLNFGVNNRDTGSLAPNVQLRGGQYLPQSFETEARKFSYYFHPCRGTISLASHQHLFHAIFPYIIDLVLALYRIYREAKLHLNFKNPRSNYTRHRKHLKRRFHAENASNVCRPR